MKYVCNVEYVYVYNICEERFGGSWWSFSWLGQSNPFGWHTDYACLSIPTNPLDHCFSSLVDSKGNKRRQLIDTVFPCITGTTV